MDPKLTANSEDWRAWYAWSEGAIPRKRLDANDGQPPTPEGTKGADGTRKRPAPIEFFDEPAPIDPFHEDPENNNEETRRQNMKKCRTGKQAEAPIGSLHHEFGQHPPPPPPGAGAADVF